jgi:hypothetical protein
MSQDILGNSIEIDMVGGRPLGEVTEEKKAEAGNKVKEAIRHRNQLLMELQEGNNPFLKIVLSKYAARLAHLASKDDMCRTFEEMLSALNYEINVAPRVAEHKARQILGDLPLPEFEEPAAPDGIPAEK